MGGTYIAISSTLFKIHFLRQNLVFKKSVIGNVLYYGCERLQEVFNRAYLGLGYDVSVLKNRVLRLWCFSVKFLRISRPLEFKSSEIQSSIWYVSHCITFLFIQYLLFGKLFHESACFSFTWLEGLNRNMKEPKTILTTYMEILMKKFKTELLFSFYTWSKYKQVK